MDMIWQLLQDVYRNTARARQKVFQGQPSPVLEVAQGVGLALPRLASFLYHVENYNIEALSAAHYLRRNCYYAAPVLEAEYADFASAGLVTSNPDGTFRMSDRGREVYGLVMQATAPRWSMETVPAADLDRIIALLTQAAQATFDHADPDDHWSTVTRARHAYRFDGPLPPLQRINVLTFDLWAFRDDVHLLAWRDHNVSPRTWESFSYLWKGDANSADTLSQALTDYHGFSLEEYAQSLAELESLGWIEQADEPGTYRLTAHGASVREAAEVRTNTLFAAAWDALTTESYAELVARLTQLNETLLRLAA